MTPRIIFAASRPYAVNAAPGHDPENPEAFEWDPHCVVARDTGAGVYLHCTSAYELRQGDTVIGSANDEASFAALPEEHRAKLGRALVVRSLDARVTLKESETREKIEAKEAARIMVATEDIRVGDVVERTGAMPHRWAE